MNYQSPSFDMTVLTTDTNTNFIRMKEKPIIKYFDATVWGYAKV